MYQSKKIASGNPEFRAAVTKRIKDLGYYEELIDPTLKVLFAMSRPFFTSML